MKTLILILTLVGSAPLPAWATPGDPDPTFGSAGTTRVGFGAGDDFGVSLTTRSGKYLVAGSSDDAEKGDLIVVRYLSDGSPDPTFGVEGIARLSSGPQSNAGATAMALMSDDRILVAGTDNGSPIIGRFLSNGAPDLSFGANGILSLPSLPISSICGIAQQGTKMIIGSSFHSGSIYHFGLARLSEDGTLDPTFDGDGIARFPILQESFASGMTIQADLGKIVLVGYARDSSSHRAVAVVRCDANGAPDATFDGDGIAVTYAGSGDSYGYAVAIQGYAPVKLVVVGDYGPPAGPRNALIIRYNNNGAPDPTFGPAAGTGIVIQPIGAGDDTFRSVTVRYTIIGNPDRVIAAGSTKSGTSGNISDVAVCQYLLTGALDTAIDGDGIIVTSTSSTDDRANSVLTAAARIVVAGFSGFGGSAPDVLLIAYRSTNGTLDTGLDSDGIKLLDIGNAITYAAAVALQADGKVVLAGTASHPLNAMAVTRLNTDGSRDPGFSADGRTLISFGTGSSGQGAANDVVVQPDGRVVLAGTTGAYPSTSLGVARLLTDGMLDPSFSADGVWRSFTNEEGWGVAVQPDGAMVVVGNSTGSTSRLRVTRLLSDGSNYDISFGVSGVFETLAGGSQAFGRDVLVLPDGRIVVAGFVAPTGNLPTQVLILALTATGALDPTFGTGGLTTVDVGPLSDAAYEVAMHPDGGLVACGVAMKSSSASDPCVLRFDAAGHLDPAFSGDGIYTRSAGSNSESFTALALQPDGRILLCGGSVLPDGLTADQLVMRLTPDGNPDATFGAAGVRLLDSGSAGDAAAGITVIPDGRIVVAGANAYLMSASRLEGGPSSSAVPDPVHGARTSLVGLARPNPTLQGTAIEYELPAGQSAVSAGVFDAAGRLVRHLPPSSAGAGGRGRITWDGADTGGVRVARGVYFVRIRIADRAETRRVVVG